MYNIVDYVKWRGDIPFSAVQPNEVDLLICAELVHCPFENLQTLHGETLSELSGLIYPAGEKQEESQLMKQRRELWQAACGGKRFGTLQPLLFTSRFDPETEKQFAAVLLKAGTIGIVAFRGTDATLVGWKEDFNLALDETIPAQQEAAAFLKKCAPYCNELYVCGHSKGGNLAMYAASACSTELGAKLICVCNYDGPGLNDTLIATPEWKSILERVYILVPESSVIGMLFADEPEPVSIASDSISILQHNPFNWHVMGAHFDRADGVNFSSRLVRSTVHSFLQSCPVHKRRVMIDSLYELLSISDAKYLRDIPMGLIRHAGEVNETLQKMPVKERNQLNEALHALAEAGGDSLLNESLGNLSRKLAQLTGGTGKDK